MYLSDDEFLRTFNMSKQDFEKQPHWKKISLKSSVGLF